MTFLRPPQIRPLPFVLAGLTSLAMLFPLACEQSPNVGGTGGTSAGTGGSGSTGAVCKIPDTSLCGGACTTSAQCPTGLYCDAVLGTCQAACVAGELASPDCGGLNCRSDGSCSTGTSSGGTGGDGGLVVPASGGQGMGGDGTCIDVDVDFDPQIPGVVLLIDRSASMNAADGFGDAVDAAIDAGTYASWDCGNSYDWRWNVVRNVLLNPDTGVVAPLEDRIRFGLSLYSNSANSPTCPILTTVDLALGNREAMLEEFECSSLQTETPTRESLTATADALALQEVSGAKVIVLATDGAPDSCACPNWVGDGIPNAPEECTQEAKLAEQAAVVAEAARIYNELGIVVHVVDVSSPTQTELHAHLTEVAAAGGGQIFDGTDPGGLAEAFATITQDAQSCAIDLDGEIATGKEGTGTVTLNGVELELDGPDGWVVNTPTQIELVGAACAATKTGQAAIDISFPCDAFVVK